MPSTPLNLPILLFIYLLFPNVSKLLEKMLNTHINTHTHTHTHTPNAQRQQSLKCSSDDKMAFPMLMHTQV
jgi:hypothetical protein